MFRQIGFKSPLKDKKQPSIYNISKKSSKKSNPFKCTCYIQDSSLFFKVSFVIFSNGSYYKVNNVWFELEDFREYAAFEAIGLIEEYFGRFASDMILAIWKDLGLPFWKNENILKPL